MIEHRWVALVSLLALLAYFWMALQVPRARTKCGIAAPAMTGDPLLERTIRAHYNTLEWLPLFLVSMWLFAVYWNELIAAAVGAVWVVARIVYALGYYSDASRRAPGFMVQSLAVAVLLFGALGKIIYSLATGGV
jgi:glutathione S-transferase